LQWVEAERASRAATRDRQEAELAEASAAIRERVEQSHQAREKFLRDNPWARA